MFTGLVQQVGSVASVDHQLLGSRLSIQLSEYWPLALGESIAVDGVCTTVVSFDLKKSDFQVELSPETISKTTLGMLQPGEPVNLEKPLTLSEPLGGHFVTGHVDGLATILSRRQEGMSWIYEFQLADSSLACYLLQKGSIAVSGISLTVNTVDMDRFSVAIIPYTLDHTHLGRKSVGDSVNVEMDLLGKYVERLLRK